MNIQKFKKYFDIKFIKFLNEKFKNDFKFIKNNYLNLYFNHLINFAEKGKRIRSFIFYSIASAYNKKNKDCLKIMISLELLHLFALIQDDIMDKAKTRRETLTLNYFIYKNSKIFLNKNKKDYSNNISILLSDIVFNIFYNNISNLKNNIKKEFYKMINEVLIGQFLDIFLANETNLNSNFKDIKNKTLKKTAYYTFVRPLIIGGIFCNLKSKELKKLEKIGILMGEIFQTQDDLFDYYLSEDKQDKDRFNDLKEGQKTYITYYIFNKTSIGKNFSRFFYKKLNQKDKQYLNKLITEKSGVKKYIENIINLKSNNAQKIISSLKNKKVRQNLKYILNLIINRKS
ncbi:MAG: polyprenyl synthetase family protein [Minisyncoccia bacterium]